MLAWPAMSHQLPDELISGLVSFLVVWCGFKYGWFVAWAGFGFSVCNSPTCLLSNTTAEPELVDRELWTVQWKDGHQKFAVARRLSWQDGGGGCIDWFAKRDSRLKLQWEGQAALGT